MKTLKRTWADISLDNLEYNYRSIRAHLPSGTRFLGVMKADAYGHGAVPVSRAWPISARSIWPFPIWRRPCRFGAARCACQS